MKKTIFALFIMCAIASCKKDEPEPQDDDPDVCNCGIITNESWNQQQGTFTIWIESECSGVVASFQSDLSTYQNYSTGDRICKNNVDPW